MSVNQSITAMVLITEAAMPTPPASMSDLDRYHPHKLINRVWIDGSIGLKQKSRNEKLILFLFRVTAAARPDTKEQGLSVSL